MTDGDGWTVDATAEGTVVQRERVHDATHATVRANAGWLALAVYGRIRVDTAAFEIDGPPSTADQFAALFGPRR